MEKTSIPRRAFPDSTAAVKIDRSSGGKLELSYILANTFKWFE